jgi:epoxyqueuosine reductase QueG
MIPILNQHLKNEELESENEDIKDSALEDEITDEEYDTTETTDSGFFSEVPACAKVGLGVVGAGAVALGICKLLANDDKNQI